jgi:hypothetical protein
MEGEFCYGRTNAVCGPAQGRGDDGFAVPEFGISRKTGYKIFERYQQCGLEGLSDEFVGPFATPTSYPSK